MNNKSKIQKEKTIELAIDLAFEAGKWYGQVELESHFDNEQYASSSIESLYARKNAMPMEKESTGRTVQINLRSKKWRKGVISSAENYKNKALDLIKHV